MKTVLITGGSGFFGGVLKERLLREGYFCVNVDLIDDPTRHENLISYKMDIREYVPLHEIFVKHKFDAVFHCAAMLAHAITDDRELWDSNVTGTQYLAELTREFKISRFIFISTNCLWARPFKRPVLETDTPEPVELYGKSKHEAERSLIRYTGLFHVIIIRTPTIIDAGRIGLLSILFDFIREGRKVWLVGAGNNRYQFVYAEDLADACVKAMDYNSSDVFNVGSDEVKTLKEIYEYVISKAGTKAEVKNLPKGLTIFLMKLAYLFRLSPLGPYHYKMIAEDFIFDTQKIKKKLNWQPTLTNEEILYKAYQYYTEHLNEIKSSKNTSAHKQRAKMGVINFLKWIS